MIDRTELIASLEGRVMGGVLHNGGYIHVPQEEAEQILALLKEQEAIEPVLEQDSMVCGVCGHEVIWQKMLGDGIWADEKLNYCPHCGRAVKWNETY